MIKILAAFEEAGLLDEKNELVIIFENWQTKRPVKDAGLCVFYRPIVKKKLHDRKVFLKMFFNLPPDGYTKRNKFVIGYCANLC